MRAAAQHRPAEWFPEGRNPWTDLYTPNVVRSIGGILRHDKPIDLDELGVLLCRIAEVYITIADETAPELKDAKRAKWIEKQIIGPATALIGALDRQNSFYFSKWPDREPMWLERAAIGRTGEPPAVKKSGNRLRFSAPSRRAIHPYLTASHRDLLLDELGGLVAWAQGKRDQALLKQKPMRKPRTQWRHELVYDLLLLYVHITKRTPTRKTYKGVKGTQGEFIDFVRSAAKPVLERYEYLDDQIQKAIARHKDEKTELWMRAHFFI